MRKVDFNLTQSKNKEGKVIGATYGITVYLPVKNNLIELFKEILELPENLVIEEITIIKEKPKGFECLIKDIRNNYSKSYFLDLDNEVFKLDYEEFFVDEDVEIFKLKEVIRIDLTKEKEEIERGFFNLKNKILELETKILKDFYY